MTRAAAAPAGAELRRLLARAAEARRRDQQGAIAAMVAIMLTVVIGMAAIAVDLGMQRVVRSDMQALADVVALDAARLLDGRTAAEIRSGNAEHAPLETVVAASVGRNSATLGSVSDWEVVLVATETGPHGDLRPVSVDHDGNPETPPEPQEVAGTDVPDAVHVRTRGTVDFAFVPGSGAASRSAMATASSGACFSLGSYAASLSPGSAPLFKDLLGPLVGSSTLNLVGYNGLASAHISLLDIITAPSIGVGTVDEVLALPSISVGSFYLASAHALRGQGQIAEADVFQAASARAVAPIQINLGELFGLSTATDAALASRFNALDLLTGAAFLANGDNLVGIPNLQAGLPSVGVTNTSLSIIERPQRACNEDEAKTAQIRLTSDVKLSLAIPLIKTPLVDLRLTDPTTGNPSGDAGLALAVQIAGARATLTSVDCTPDTFAADVWSDLVTLRLGGNVQLRGTVKVTLDLGPLSLPTVVDVPVKFNLGIVSEVSKPADTSPTSVQFVSPPQSYGDPVKAGGGSAIMPHVTIAMVPGTLETGPVTVLGVPISTSVLDAAVNPVLAGVMPSISSSIAPLVNPLIDKVNGILGPLTAGMGITLAGADFYAYEAPECSAPRLRH
ncbi:pilus assembly protein TadG-related protein [Nocardioides sp.]|uniref:pilus assembly protein TadG-related protein n=1 Tax=Nocardioides sp. TaxID=35761 RepID=UPI00273629CC|nr:pilus assembly protein TadG-related protein [Nocardioides sp.]MDP3892584.1 pilus assembly protein TadG-related protein [Nocardioides sp.]